jgi:hypothetical protein
MDHKGLSTATSPAESGGGGAFLFLVLGLLILLLSAPAVAQVPGGESPQRQASRRYKTLSIDDQVKGLTKNLDLDQAQQSAVKKILEGRQQETLRIWRETSGSDRIIQFRALQQHTAVEIRAVLNDAQKEKYNPFGQRPPQQAAGQPSVEDWMKATARH